MIARDPRPSAHDFAEAKRLRLPVVVITTEGVVAAMPDGRMETVERRRLGG